MNELKKYIYTPTNTQIANYIKTFENTNLELISTDSFFTINCRFFMSQKIINVPWV